MYSLLFGPGRTVGQALAAHPEIKAIAFTGSQAGGTALMATAAARAEPIPVYAEMSSINPQVVLAGAAAGDLDSLAAGYVGPLTLGAGQFCTNPGLVLAPESDHEAAAELVPLLERKAGRLIANGWPTEVEVNHAMVHGGPFPATSDPRSTSVGALAIRRFQRPVCYQNFPPALLPDAVRDGNPLSLPRRINGEP